MVGRDVTRHMLPPALALLLSMGIIGMLHKGGLTQLNDASNLAVFAPMVLLLSAACWWLFRPRPSVDRDESAKPLPIWRVVAPLMAFLAGPGTVVLLWVAAVYGFKREYYVTNHERLEVLIAALPVGLVVGFLVSLLVLAWMASSD